jgi:hypothetical protein
LLAHATRRSRRSHVLFVRTLKPLLLSTGVNTICTGRFPSLPHRCLYMSDAATRSPDHLLARVHLVHKHNFFVGQSRVAVIKGTFVCVVISHLCFETSTSSCAALLVDECVSPLPFACLAVSSSHCSYALPDKTYRQTDRQTDTFFNQCNQPCSHTTAFSCGSCNRLRVLIKAHS